MDTQTDENQQVAQTTKGFNVIFLHSSLDDAGLTPNEFRVLAHLSRRAGNNDNSWAANESMAKVCRMHPDTLKSCLLVLQARKMIKKTERPGKTTLWWITPPDTWIMDVPPGTGANGRPVSYPVESNGRGYSHPPESNPPHPPGNKGGDPHESNPPEGKPRKGIKGRESKGRSRGAPPILPVSLNTPEFVKTWGMWEDYRKENRFILSPTTVMMQYRKLEKVGPARAIEAINESMTNGWRGLFPHNGVNGTNGHSPPRRSPIPEGRLLEEHELIARGMLKPQQ